MKQRIKFSEAPSIGTIALRGAVGGKGVYVAPRFGPHCVCCNADANGRLQGYVIADDKISAEPLPMPVCLECKDHALRTSVPLRDALLLMGLVLLVAGIYYATQRPIDRILAATIASGVLLSGGGVLAASAVRRRQDRLRGVGHHPELVFGIKIGSYIDTTNETLVEELRTLNPHAFMTTPLLWRRRNKRDFPSARAKR